MTRLHLAPIPALRTASILVFACGLILLFDLGGELHAALIYGANFSTGTWLHLTGELASAIGLGTAFILMRRDTRRAIAETNRQRSKLDSLRHHFDDFLQSRFKIWGLSPAEADIALLTIRGLKISEIAAMRDTREGTIKSQLSAIFRKSNVASRTAFVAQFIDEFLDISASDGNAAHAAPAD